MRAFCSRPTFDFMAMFERAFFGRWKSALFADNVGPTRPIHKRLSILKQYNGKPFTSDPVSG